GKPTRSHLCCIPTTEQLELFAYPANFSNVKIAVLSPKDPDMSVQHHEWVEAEKIDPDEVGSSQNSGHCVPMCTPFDCES
ncbi:MAG: hypothetical protein ACPGGL_06635, partial [Phycisphaerales bacterium]